MQMQNSYITIIILGILIIFILVALFIYDNKFYKRIERKPSTAFYFDFILNWDIIKAKIRKDNIAKKYFIILIVLFLVSAYKKTLYMLLYLRLLVKSQVEYICHYGHFVVI